MSELALSVFFNTYDMGLWALINMLFFHCVDLLEVVHPLEVASRYRDPQFQGSKITNI